VVDAVEVGQGTIGAGDGVGEDDVHLAAELVEDFGEGEGGTDGVAVRAGMGGKEEAGVSAERGQESGDMGLVRQDLTRLGCGGLECKELGVGCHDLAVTG
jgi:hypothetical protein